MAHTTPINPGVAHWTGAVPAIKVGAAWLALTVALLLLMDMRLPLYDEGIILVGAQEVLHGAIPHRDFYANYGPASFYGVAAVFAVFGESAYTLRGLDLAFRAAAVLLSFAILRSVCRPVVAWGAALTVFFWMVGAKTYGYPIFPVLTLALWQVFILTSHLERIDQAKLILVGALTGVIAAFRYDMGFFVAVAHAAAFLALSASFSWKRADFLRLAGMYVAGMLVVVLPIAAGLAFAGALNGLHHDIFQFSAKEYARMRGLPFPGRGAIAAHFPAAAVYVPFLCIAVTAPIVVRSRGHRAYGCAILLTFLSVAFVLKSVVRVGLVPMVPAIVSSTLLAAVVLEMTRRPTVRIFAPISLAISGMFGLAVLAAAIRTFAADPGLSFVGQLAGVAPKHGAASNLPGTEGFVVPRDALRAAAFIAQGTTRQDRIFVANGRHDKINRNSVALYFAAGRRPGSHWYHFDPGLQTSEPIQRKIVEELGGVRWVVMDPSSDDASEPNASAISSEVHLLDDYLRSNYREAARFGGVTVLSANK